MAEEIKTFTLTEVAEHNEKKSVWIIIHDCVYDVTPFLDEVCYFFFRILVFNINLKKNSASRWRRSSNRTSR